MATIRPITDRVAVAPQISPDDIADIKAAGYVAIVNNRPDDEEAEQPAGEAIRDAAELAGLAYHEIPIVPARFGHPEIDAMAEVLDAAGGPVLAFCRSGTRSCNVWALASAKRGADPAELERQAAEAGYDLSALRPTLDALAAR